MSSSGAYGPSPRATTGPSSTATPGDMGRFEKTTDFATCTCSLCLALAGMVHQPLRVAPWYIYTLPFVQSLWEIENWATNRWVLLAMSALLACAAVTVMRLRRTV